MYLIRDMQETSSDVLQLVKDENTVQKLNFLSYDIKNGQHIFPVLPFLDKDVYLKDDENPEDAIKEEIAYNKRVLANGLFSLLAVYEELKTGKKDFVSSMSSQEFMRGVMEAYVKLKVWNVDIQDVTYLYNVKINGVEEKLTKENLEWVFNGLIGPFLSNYQGSLSSAILQKYLYDIQQEKNQVPVKEKKPFLQSKKTRETGQKRKDKKIQLEKIQKQKDVKTVLQDVLTHYEFKNMSDSGFTSIYTPVDCVEEDYARIKNALLVYEQFIPGIRKDLVDYIAYKNDPEGFLKPYKNEKGALNVEGKLRKLQLDAMASDVSLVEEKVLDLLNYYKFLRMYQTRSNEALTDQETQKNNKELEDILLVCVPFLPERKDAYQKRLDY